MYTIKSKNMVFDKFKVFKSLVENQCEPKIKMLWTDNGKEYCNEAFKSFLGEGGIIHQLTVPYTPQQNRLAERMNRSIVEKACLMFDANLAEEF